MASMVIPLKMAVARCRSAWPPRHCDARLYNEATDCGIRGLGPNCSLSLHYA
jgi:hypothetical protein